MIIDKTELRKLALAATPGPWSTNQRGRYWHDEEADVVDAEDREVTGVEFVKPIGDVYTTRGQVYADDATYVAAANPAVMLALLDEIEALRAAAMPDIAHCLACSAILSPAPERSGVAKRRYTRWTDEQGIHCNRLPAWDEMSAGDRADWLRRNPEAGGLE